jgi:hypothetical protein
LGGRGFAAGAATAPTMPGFKDYLITYWYGPPVAETTEARYREVAQAGFNLVAPPATDQSGVTYPMFDPPLGRKTLDLAKQSGMRGLVYDSRMDQILNKGGDVNSLVDGMVADYKDHPALYGYFVADEPGADLFPKLGRIVARFREKDPGHVAVINLFPDYAPLEVLKSGSYREHLERYVSEVKPPFISYDHYHFMQPDSTTQRPVLFAGERERAAWEAAHAKSKGFDRGGFFNNLEVVRDVAKANHLPFMVCVLLTTHGPYRDLTEPELRWEAFQCLAYGSSGLCWFTYWSLPDDEVWHFRNAVINWGGKRTDHYDHVKRVNADLRALGDRLVGRESLAVCHVGPEADGDVKPFAPFGAVQAIAGGRLTIGFFDGGYALLANKDYRQPATVTITLAAGTKARMFDRVKGRERALKVKGGQLTLTLPPGDAELLRLF